MKETTLMPNRKVSAKCRCNAFYGRGRQGASFNQNCTLLGAIKDETADFNALPWAFLKGPLLDVKRAVRRSLRIMVRYCR